MSVSDCTWKSLSRFCMEAVPRKDKTMREGALELELHPTSTCSVRDVDSPKSQQEEAICCKIGPCAAGLGLNSPLCSSRHRVVFD